ncbi:hypothetical protein LT493_14705 [Streptomyces tricolor]|nr:hypothetical protein [Streptomyces tricolor]
MILADGFSCRTQLDQLAGVRGRHLAEVLADALDAPATGADGALGTSATDTDESKADAGETAVGETDGRGTE